ncbi:ABC transporter substrate-binding protein [Rhodalgimonas zhirmunskyi]|uniref:ABC transporter substrate-binding protein n=1 Tax=Rhodalgimonas zhirmunskyi TaxID=2964767 RepID=A0AAJ1UAR6_9RHOB|nr:ABC transporter substrate-binding protein [Rhodoalgimonas zhirmunskyi]MDQ2095010.1 ABC transporter substrate-binding protein [Rhodoalgimonas zhirmunskyi]
MKRREFLAGTAMAAALSTLPMTLAQAATPPNMLVIANRIDDITTLDPAESFEFAGSDVSRNVYGKLVNFDPMDLDAGYGPDLAESWTVSEDGKTITFKMRAGVKFHSGNPVTAKDAEYSLRRAVILEKTPSFILTQFGFSKDNVEETIKATDDMTLVITTDQKYATSFVLNCLTSTIGGIVDMKTVMEHEVDGDMGNAWLKTNTAGSGAYKLISWKPNESVSLQANPDFYLGKPAMERVIVRHVQESASQRLLLERGDIDVARNLNPEDVKGITGKDGIAIDSELRGRIMYISLNQKHPELSKPEVKEAIKYLIDYEGMQNSFLNGQYAIHQNFLPRTYLGAIDDAPYSLNVEKAKELLAKAGVENLEITAGVRDAQERIEIGQSIQNTLAQAGIKLNLVVGTGKQTLSKYRARELDMYIGAWGPDYPDPQTNAGTFAYNPDNSDDAGLTGLLAWRNAWNPGDLTAQVDAAVIEGDRDTRKKMYEDMQREFLKTSPFAIMFQKIEQTGRRDNVKNLNLGGAITAVSYWPVTK